MGIAMKRPVLALVVAIALLAPTISSSAAENYGALFQPVARGDLSTQSFSNTWVDLLLASVTVTPPVLS